MYRFVAAAVLFAATVLAQEPFELKTEGDILTLTIHDDGVAMVDFVKLAERVTGRAFTFSAKEIAAADPVKIIGSVRMKKDAFLQFFQTTVYAKGLVAVARGEGDSAVIEIALARRSGQSAAEARYVAAAELESHKADTPVVLTSIALAHLAPQDAIDRLHPVLAATATQATLARVGQSLLVQGTGAEVYCVSRMVRLIDVPPVEVVEVVSLRHAVATELAKSLKALVAGQKPKVVVVAHDKANSLMISGPPAIVREVVELAVLLDRPVKVVAGQDGDRRCWRAGPDTLMSHAELRGGTS